MQYAPFSVNTADRLISRQDKMETAHQGGLFSLSYVPRGRLAPASPSGQLNKFKAFSRKRKESRRRVTDDLRWTVPPGRPADQ